MVSFLVSICFSFLSLPCLFLCSCGLSFVFRFSLLLPYFFLCCLYSSAVCITPRFGYLLLAVCFGWFLPASPLPHPFLRLVPLQSLPFLLCFRFRVGLISSFCSGLPPLPSFASFPIPCLLLLRWFSLSLSPSPSWVFSPALVTLLQGCLSIVVRLRLSFSLRLLQLRLLCAEGGRGGGESPVLFVFYEPKGGPPAFVLFHPPGCLLSLFFVVLRGVSLPIRYSGYFRLLLRCLVLTYLLWCFFLIVVRCLSAVVLLSFHFSLPSGRARLLFRLSCLSLVVVLYSHVSFFSLRVRLFLLFCLCCLFSASLLSVVFPFSSPGICFLFFAVCSSLLCLSAALSSLWWLFPVQVLGFRFPFLLILYCFHIHCGLFLCFLCFHLIVLFFLACWAPLTGVLVSVFARRLLRRFFATHRCPILDIAFAFFVSISTLPSYIYSTILFTRQSYL